VRHRTPAAVTAFLCAAAASLIALTTPAAADVITPFAPRFAANDNGVISLFGNNLLTCSVTADSRCTAARDGTATGAAANNNAYSMVNRDADSDPSTFNSSAAQVSAPDGSSVLWAGLYWGAFRRGGSGGATTTDPIDRMSLRVPGESTYRTMVSQASFALTTGEQPYQQFRDVTALVQASGPGQYWGADVATGTGLDRYAGWSLVVVYRDPTEPLRNLTVFDGFSDVGSNSSETIPISGFLAPLSGTVDARLGMVAYEGDRGATGDAAFLNTTRLATPLSPGTNFFNSSNDRDGTNVTARTPADANMLGFDIKQLGVPGVIPNGARNATVQLASTSDRYYIGVVTTQINLYAPDFTTSRKAATNVTGRDPAAAGDIVEYNLTYTNSGLDPASGSIATDPLPPNTAYVPGTLSIVDGPNAGLRTDGPGDDQAEVSGGAVRVRLGTGATAAAGGVLAPGATTTVRFRVRLGPDSPGTTVRNQAQLAYVAQTVGQPFTYVGNETATPVAVNADLQVSKTTSPDPLAAGAPATSVITVTNLGPNTAAQVVVTDTLSAGVTATAATMQGAAAPSPAKW